jgi:LPXTG-site transpeptidase (sortase) family protein
VGSNNGSLDTKAKTVLPKTTPAQSLHTINSDDKAKPKRHFQKFRDFQYALSNMNFSQRLVVGMAAVLFVAGLLVTIQGFLANRAVGNQVAGSTVLARSSGPDDGSEDQPSETKPSVADVSQYSVAPDNPRVLIIPKIGVNSRVKPLGTNKDNSLSTPTNIYDVGWYTKSSKPGEIGGATLIDGHVHGIQNEGVFYNLKTLETGDRISIERGDGKTINYLVVSKETISKDNVDMAKALISADPTKPGLNLITCTGKYLPKEKTYDQRLVMYAVQE